MEPEENEIDLDAPLVFELSKPIKFGSDTIETLNLRPFTAKDMAGIKRDFDPTSCKMTVVTDATILLKANLV